MSALDDALNELNKKTEELEKMKLDLPEDDPTRTEVDALIQRLRDVQLSLKTSQAERESIAASIWRGLNY